MIADLLPRYYAVKGDNITFRSLRSIVIDGHEVAWMEMQPRGRRTLFCECDFAEGVGWSIVNGKVGNMDGYRKCLYRQATIHLRHLELRREYMERYGARSGDSTAFVFTKHIGEIILDLIEKVKAGEFVEDGIGAAFWGGYFYLQTVAAITDKFVGHLWEDVYLLMTEKKIGLDGAVIQPYREPPPPLWEECIRVEDPEDSGWYGTASLPDHREMALEWKLAVYRPDGTEAYGFIPGLSLEDDPVFGPSVDDVARAKEALQEIIKEAKARKNKDKAP